MVCVSELFVFVCESCLNVFVWFVCDLLCDHVWHVVYVVMRLCVLCVIDCAMSYGLRSVFVCICVCSCNVSV